MKNFVTLSDEAQKASQQTLLAIEQFLHDNYLFRRNILSGKVEFAVLPLAEQDPESSAKLSESSAEPTFRPLTQEALNSIILRAKREQICEKGNPKATIIEYVQSEEVAAFNPIGAFLDGLPQWDGQDHMNRLFSRLPGISTEQHNFLAIWLRSVVAHWLQMDMLHGNECVPTLIGDQGCGKTTFVRRLLPPELRCYYLDHLNLSNKFDKEMALTNNLLVNLDELEAIRPSQHAALKQTLSKSKVNGRPIFGRAQDDRLRFASFVATTNNPHPLTDATGSRRYICLKIPKGLLIDNTGDIDYGQLYAQVLYELRVKDAPYWFNQAEVARIQELNLDYMAQCDIAEMIAACFRKPIEGESGKSMNSSQMLDLIRGEYPSVKSTHSMKVKLGLEMKELGFDHVTHCGITYYKLVPLVAA